MLAVIFVVVDAAGAAPSLTTANVGDVKEVSETVGATDALSVSKPDGAVHTKPIREHPSESRMLRRRPLSIYMWEWPF